VASFNNIFQALPCLERIQDFLVLEKRTDHRTSARIGPIARMSTGECPALRVECASFGWTKSAEETVLRDIDVSIPASTLTLVVGPIASGKSTFLKSLLGETYLHSGTVYVSDFEEIAYCDQDSWILNETIRQNIVAFSEYSEGFYNSVVKACQLEEDLSQLPQGDLTNVGSQGISLSGGQKARVVSPTSWGDY
jgi:ATP-binding cassette, subfamily C (CFTR/MRP), member 1